MLGVQDGDAAERHEAFDVVLACDGAGSAVRHGLRVPMQGPASLARFVSCYFTADLDAYFGADSGPVHFIGGPDVSGALISFDLRTTWALMCAVPPETAPETVSHWTAAELIHRAIGDPSVDVELLSVGTWNMSAQVAEDYRHGPFFLVGDAAHRFPPSGGLGLNTGVQDAHNLA